MFPRSLSGWPKYKSIGGAILPSLPNITFVISLLPPGSPFLSFGVFLSVVFVSFPRIPIFGKSRLHTQMFGFTKPGSGKLFCILV